MIPTLVKNAYDAGWSLSGSLHPEALDQVRQANLQAEFSFWVSQPHSSKADDTPWKRNKIFTHAVVVGKGHLDNGNCERYTDIANTLDLSAKPTEDEKTDSSACPCCGKENIIGATFCRCGVKQKNSTEDEERKAQATLEDGFAKIRALTQFEIIPHVCAETLTHGVMEHQVELGHGGRRYTAATHSISQARNTL